MIRTLINAGQYGADRGSLQAALRMKLLTAGYAPKGYYTGRGVDFKLYTVWGLLEAEDGSTKAAAELNILTSDGTVVFGPKTNWIEELRAMCKEADKPCLYIEQPKGGNPEFEFRLWVERNHIRCLHSTGNTEHMSRGIGDAVEAFLCNTVPYCK